MYVMICTRPDIVEAVRFIRNPYEEHNKRILKYIKRKSGVVAICLEDQN